MSDLAPISAAIASMQGPVSREQIERLQAELVKLPQYEPITRHYFHAGMYCREVWRAAGVLVVGKVHKAPHFYMIVSGTVRIDGGDPITGPCLMQSEPGTKRAVLSLTPALCVTFHRTDAKTVEAAEAELVEEDPQSTYDAGNRLRAPVLEVLK